MYAATRLRRKRTTKTTDGSRESSIRCGSILSPQAGIIIAKAVGSDAPFALRAQ
jgi:hypothetical protein